MQETFSSAGYTRIFIFSPRTCAHGVTDLQDDAVAECWCGQIPSCLILNF
jgi:hypothetical protein